MGSPVYMAPEQARGMKAIDQRADLWSVGVVLYRALAGCTPHPENDTVGDMILSICTATPPPLRTLAPWVPAAVAALCERAMSRDPAARFPTAEAMLAAVQTLLPHGYAIETSMLVSQSADPGPKRRARSRSLAAGVIFGVVLAAAAARVASSRAPAHAAVEPAQPPVSAPSAGASPVPEP
jgi:serine/threonine-protein kinase